MKCRIKFLQSIAGLRRGNMSRFYHCIGCKNSFASPQSLWNHKQRCYRLKSQGFSPKKNNIADQNTDQNCRSKSIPLETKMMNVGRSKTKAERNTSEKKKSACHIPTQKQTVFLSSSVDGLYNKLGVLTDQLETGNTAVTPIILSILRKLKEKDALNRRETKETYTQIQDSADSDSETDESASGMDEETSRQDSESDMNEQSTEDEDDEEFDQLILDVADTLTQNEKKNLLHTLLAVKNEERRRIESWLEGEESLEKILPLLKDSLDMMKIKILMKQIDERRKKVDKVLRALRNITNHGELKDVLDELKSQDVITDREYKRLIVADHDLQSYVKAFQGSGIWI